MVYSLLKMPKINFEYFAIILFSLSITAFCSVHLLGFSEYVSFFNVLYNNLLKNKTDVNKCSAKHVVFETSVNVNNISENNIMCSLKNASILRNQHFHTKI